MSGDPVRQFVRHAVATLAYRGAKVLQGAPEGFGKCRAADASTKTRSAVEILAHLNDLLEWTALLVPGGQGWHASTPQSWEKEVDRFYEGLRQVDAALCEDPVAAEPMAVQPVAVEPRAAEPRAVDPGAGKPAAKSGTSDAYPLSLERIFQGPIADAFTHLGQLALLRRLAGAPVRPEVMILSKVEAGKVGPDQPAPVREFD